MAERGRFAPRDRKDEQGAILVIGVFAAVFLVGVLSYVVGIGDAVLRREQLGDAADAVSMAAATVHARAMNLLVLVNQVMAALLAVLVALRLVEMLATLAILILLGAAFLGAAAGLAAVPGLETVRSGARNAYGALDEPIHGCLRALHFVSHAVAAATPAIAELRAAAVVPELDPKSGVTTGFVVPPRITLPVEDDAFSVLCDHAGKDAADVAMIPLSPLLPGGISSDVESALGDLAGSASDWFCGKDGGQPPVIERTITRVLPVLAARARCEASTRAESGTASSDCAGVNAEEAASEPDESGECRTDCGRGGSYEERVTRARAECNPGRRVGLRGFQWQERTVRVEYVNRGGAWIPTGRRWEDAPRRVSSGDASYVHPCGTPQALYSTDFETALHPEPGSPAAPPVCSTKPSFPVQLEGVPVVVEITEVLQLFRCLVNEKRTIGGNFDDAGRAQSSDDEAPTRVVADAVLGGETFQLRGVVLAGEPDTHVDRVVSAAAWGARVQDPASDIAALGQLSVSQAEYYFDHDGSVPRAEWMWSRKWTARLRRFRIPIAVRAGSARTEPSAWLGAFSDRCPASVAAQLGELSSH